MPKGAFPRRHEVPDEFVIDYVRIWQRCDLASSLDGKKAPAKAN